MASRLVLIGCLGLTGLAVAPVAHASFPGRNGGIAFAQRIASGDSDPQFVERFRLVTAPPGSEQRRILLECVLTDGVPSRGDCSGTGYGSPSYSPDGRMLVFDAGQRIGVIDADGGGRVALFPAASSDDGSPAFAPDSNRIVFSGGNDRGTTDIYVRRMNGGAPRLIVNDAGEPAWSSRNRVAYVRSGNIYSARPDGRQRRFVTSGVSPDWSPDGRRLLFVRPSPRLVFDGPFGQMYVSSAGGAGLRAVRARNDAFWPVWSPDGRSIAYGRFDQGVFAKRLGSRRPARLVAQTQVSGESGSVTASDPAWRPRPPS